MAIAGVTAARIASVEADLETAFAAYRDPLYFTGAKAHAGKGGDRRFVVRGWQTAACHFDAVDRAIRRQEDA